jgi:hypothetical protein
MEMMLLVSKRNNVSFGHIAVPTHISTDRPRRREDLPKAKLESFQDIRSAAMVTIKEFVDE